MVAQSAFSPIATNVDFTQLYDSYVKGREDRRQQRAREKLANLPTGPNGQLDLQAAARDLMEYDPNLATRFMQLDHQQRPKPAAAPASYREFQLRQQNPDYASYLDQQSRRDPQLVNAGGGNLYNPATGQWIQAPNAGQQSIPDSVQALDLRAQRAGLQPGTPEYNQFMVTGGKGGTSLSVSPDGSVQFSQGGVRPMTEAQSKDAVYATRAEGALQTIDQHGNALTNLGESVGGAVPIIGNYAKSEPYQRAEQAGNEFLQAILRKDTGAAITVPEVREYGSVYLPRPGDTPKTLAQKKLSRLRALNAIKAGMPPAAILAQEKALQATGKMPEEDGDQSNGTKTAPTGPQVPTSGAPRPQSQAAPQQQNMTARNPQTGQTIVSPDGVNWYNPQTGELVWQAQ